ncbi:MAG: glucose-1-phosphate cytidylyltransferase [Legionellales bacterium]|nr:glucose-1-phosphate cytidylyltransferase [Legionellales bacterium]
MKVVLLCGGYGTRIRDVADNIPKPMIPIGRYPILWHIMKYYSCFDFNEFVLCLGYKGLTIKEFFLNYETQTKDFTIELSQRDKIEFHTDHDESDWSVTLVDTGLNAMTGARIARIKKYVGDEDFMLTYGDGVGDIDIDALLSFHKSHNKALTVTGVRPPGRFGELVSENGQIIEFNEKPQASGGRISGGFFVARSSLFDYIDDDEKLVFEQEPIKKMVEDGEIMVYEHDSFWQPMDTSREYILLNELYEKGKAPWVKW